MPQCTLPAPINVISPGQASLSTVLAVTSTTVQSTLASIPAQIVTEMTLEGSVWLMSS